MSEEKARQVNLDLWLTKSECAGRLGCSEKTIERMVERGQLHRKIRRVPGRRNLPVFSPDDVDRLQKETLQPQPGGPSMALAVTRRPDPLTVLLDAISAKKASADLPPAPNAFLTVRQAATYIGRTQSFIRRALQAGSLPGVKDGGWRVRKADLDKL
jgi:excisionase family DNA binding protein